MRVRHPVAQSVIIIALAAIIAVVANGFASRTRQLKLPGYYPNALQVPPRVPVKVPPPARTEPDVVEPATTTTTAVITDTTGTIVPATTALSTTALSTAIAPSTTVPATTTSAAPAIATTTPTTAPAPAASAPKKVDLAKYPPHPDKAYVEISGEEAQALHAAGVLFLDARRTSVFEAGHIAGSHSYSVWEADIDDKVNKLYEERSEPAEQNRPIVIYCSGGACEDSHMLAQKLWGIQFNNVYVYKDGFPDWQQRGGAVRTGGQP
ncbi:MAG TPA: rhodanese-like domain-containing protein [Thermoanaerobaculia bacterium]|nr:rhodanese-like domain-containing protein [Thermoanaerobaculia bacterium]